MWNVGDRVRHMNRGLGTVEYVGPVNVYGTHHWRGIIVLFDEDGVRIPYSNGTTRLEKHTPVEEQEYVPKYALKKGMYVYHKDAPPLGR